MRPLLRLRTRTPRVMFPNDVRWARQAFDPARPAQPVSWRPASVVVRSQEAAAEAGTSGGGEASSSSHPAQGTARHAFVRAWQSYRAAGVVLFDVDPLSREVQVLMVQEAKGATRVLGLPGGKKEEGEQYIDTAARELEEETHRLLPAAALHPLMAHCASCYMHESKYVVLIMRLTNGKDLPALAEARIAGGQGHPEAAKIVGLQWVPLASVHEGQHDGYKVARWVTTVLKENRQPVKILRRLAGGLIDGAQVDWQRLGEQQERQAAQEGGRAAASEGAASTAAAAVEAQRLPAAAAQAPPGGEAAAASGAVDAAALPAASVHPLRGGADGSHAASTTAEDAAVATAAPVAAAPEYDPALGHLDASSSSSRLSDSDQAAAADGGGGGTGAERKVTQQEWDALTAKLKRVLGSGKPELMARPARTQQG